MRAEIGQGTHDDMRCGGSKNQGFFNSVPKKQEL